MYHPKAILTLTCNYNMAKLLSPNTNRIKKYLNLARNIKFPELSGSVYCGSSNILHVLMKLPEASHDMLNFSTDCIAYNVSAFQIRLMVKS